MDKIRRLTVPGSRNSGSATRGTAVAFFRAWRRHREALLSTEPLHLLMIHLPAFPAHPHKDAGTPISPPDLGNLSHPRSQSAVVPSAATIPRRVPIQRHNPTHSPLTQPKACHQQRGGGPFRFGPYQFFAVIAFSQLSMPVRSMWMDSRTIAPPGRRSRPDSIYTPIDKTSCSISLRSSLTPLHGRPSL